MGYKLSIPVPIFLSKVHVVLLVHQVELLVGKVPKVSLESSIVIVGAEG